MVKMRIAVVTAGPLWLQAKGSLRLQSIRWPTFTTLAMVVSCLAAFGQNSANPLRLTTSPIRPPNIILIVADDLGIGDLGCYGQSKIRTPNLDRMASEGMRFTHCYAGSSISAPSRATLLTGLHSGHSSIRDNGEQPLAASDKTIAELLKTKGYRTAIFGKWALGAEKSSSIPNQRGFDEWFGYLEATKAHNYFPEKLWRNHYQHILPRNANGRQGDYSPDWFTRTATNFIATTTNQPFFLYLAYPLPHANLELTRSSGNGMQVPHDAPYSAEPWPPAEKNKAAMITRLDRDTGKILELLKSRGIDSETIVFFTSDNGPHQEGGNDPAFFNSASGLRGLKRTLHEGGIRVPMIIRWPGRIPPGQTNSTPWAFWDFTPTAAELAGVSPPKSLDGISILPLLLNQPQTNRHLFFYWELHQPVFQQALRLENWKGWRPALGAALQLFDLNADPRETNNLASAHPDRVRRIETLLGIARTQSDRWPLPTAASSP